MEEASTLAMATSSSSPMAPEEEESWCSLYLCSRVIGIMVVVLCKSCSP